MGDNDINGIKRYSKGFVILNYNDFQTTISLVKRIIEDGISDVICIVDNNSSDDSYKKLLEIQNQGNIVIIHSEENKGYASGNNIGCKYLKEHFQIDIVFIANPDVEFTADTVEGITKTFIQNPDYAILTPIMLDSDGTVSNRPFIKIPTFWQDLLLCFYSYNRLFEKTHNYQVDYSENLMEIEAAPGSFFAIRMNVLEDIGFFDEGTFLFYEEMCLASKIKKFNCNLKIGLMTTDNYIHHHSVSIKKNISYMNTYNIYMKSKFYFEQKYHNISKVKQIFLKIAICLSCLEERCFLKIKNK